MLTISLFHFPFFWYLIIINSKAQTTFEVFHVIIFLHNYTRYIAKNLILFEFAYKCINTFFFISTSVDTEMCCPKGKCGCQYFILLTLKKKIMDTGVLDFCLIKK